MFYQGLDRKVATHGSVKLEGWNGVSHLAHFESLTHRYRSLQRYQGYFARQAEAGVFYLHGTEEELLKTTWSYGQLHPEFAQEHFRHAWPGKENWLAQN